MTAVVVDSGERIRVVVPSRNPSCVLVAIESDNGRPLVNVQIVDGLIGNVIEHVVRRHAVTLTEDRMQLWAHLVAMHATVLSPEVPLETLIELHEHEHDGPGTIRNHPRESRRYSLKRLGAVLQESEE